MMLDELIHKTMRTPYTLHIEKLQSPRRPRATLVMIHGIGSSTVMWHKLAADLPTDIRIVAVDLLGFGKSPQPGWATYDATTQARSLLKTLIINRIPPGSIFVGHSLGSLVAVEAARQLPFYPSRLVLISPPIYKPSRSKTVATQREDILRGVYKVLKRYPKNTERALALAKRYYVRRTGLATTPGINMTTYLLSLEAAIINQDTINHINQVKPAIMMISGSRDPLVIRKNLQSIATLKPSIRYMMIPRAGHNVVGTMRTGVARYLVAELSDE